MNILIDGMDIFINTGGKEFSADQSSVILIHGAGMDHSVWSQQNRYLAHHGFNIFAIDLPAHGRSGGSPLSDINQMADFISSLIDQLPCEKAMLVGHSMGAMTAFATAANHCKKVISIILCGMAATMPVHPMLLQKAKENDAIAAEFIASWGHGEKAHMGGNIANGIWMVKSAINLIKICQNDVLYNDLKACDDYKDMVGMAYQVKCPTLLLLADGDKMAPVKSAKSLLEELPNASQVIINDSGHMMMSETPNSCLDNIIKFLNR